MVFSAKSNGDKNSCSSNNEGWGMGFLLILFHHHPDNNNNNNNNNNSHEQPNFFGKKKSSISFSSKSNTNLLVSKTQSTLSICGILVFTTILLFTLSTFEPTSVMKNNYPSSRRFLKQNNNNHENTHQRFKVLSMFSSKLKGSESNFTRIDAANPALQGMGALYLRGSKSMTDLVVGHVSENTSEKELRTFIRVLIHHSGLLSRADFVLIYASPSAAARFGALVRFECDSFVQLARIGGELGRFTELGSGFSRYLAKREIGEGEKEPIWGKKRGNSSEGELTRSSYGSVVGFEASELDPEDTLSGFLDHVPMSLRRWASYPMLLGRVRRQFKHMLLVDIRDTLILSDPFSRVRNRSSESLFMWSNLDTEPTRGHHHSKRNSGKSRDSNSKPQFNPAVIVGGSRGVRRFATAALTEIVRSVIEHKGKGRNSVTESGLVNQLVHSGHLLKNINLITPTESLAELSSLGGFNSVDSASSSYLRLSDYFSVVQRGHSSGESVSLDIDEVVMKEICASHKLYSSVYNDCLVSQ